VKYSTQMRAVISSWKMPYTTAPTMVRTTMAADCRTKLTRNIARQRSIAIRSARGCFSRKGIII
jgi:hypothetical protein